MVFRQLIFVAFTSTELLAHYLICEGLKSQKFDSQNFSQTI